MSIVMKPHTIEGWEALCKQQTDEIIRLTLALEFECKGVDAVLAVLGQERTEAGTFNRGKAVATIREKDVYAEDLARVAELSENIARRLHKRGWNAEEKTQHAADLAERDRILVAVRPSYAECIQFREEQ